MLVNAVKEQQAEISKQQAVSYEQQKQIDALQQQVKGQTVEIEALKTLVCSQNPTAKVCLPKN